MAFPFASLAAVTDFVRGGDAGISVLAVSTYETDVILFREEHKDAAREALSAVADTSRLKWSKSYSYLS